MLRRLFSIVVISLCAAVTVNAQVGAGSLKGTVKDKKSSEPLPFVSVVIERGGTQVTGGSTDFDGNYFIKPIDPGTYDVVIAYTGYQPSRQTGVVINSNQITFLDITLNSGIELVEFEVVEYNVPLIQRDGGASGGTCLLYTSDAADARSSVDLGGRRIIKKKKRVNQAGVTRYLTTQ